MKKGAFILAVLFVLTISLSCGQSNPNSENKIINPEGSIVSERIFVPEGYKRVKPAFNSFGEYLQNFKLKEHGAEVHYFDGTVKPNPNVYLAVLDIDVGNRDLQQCADAIMRLRAEYLYSQKKYREIAFNFVSDGKPRYFLEYSNQKTDYKSFRKYMNYVFSYANTRSLYQQITKVDEFKNMQIGDVLIQTGNPYGHAVVVLDMAENSETGEKIYMLAQSYMPAQEIQILVNPKRSNENPWYKIVDQGVIVTPEWVFTKEDLRRF